MSKPIDLKFIPFAQLHISKLNMRHGDTPPAQRAKRIAKLFA